MNEYHDPEFPEGEYTINGDDKELAKDGLKIRVERSTKNGDRSVVGRYYQNVTFTVYQVFPAEAGIVWGRVSSNTTGTIQYCGLKVNNNRKVVLMKSHDSSHVDSLEQRVSNLETWARIQGYKG